MKTSGTFGDERPAPSAASRAMPRWLKVIIGLVFLVIGAIGLVLPILQGVLFICAGLLILAEAVPSLQAPLAHLEAKYVPVHKALVVLRNSDGSLRIRTLLIILLAISLVTAAIAVIAYK